VRIKVEGGTIDLPQNSSIIFDLQSINHQESNFGRERTGFPANEFQPLRYHPDVMKQHGLKKSDIDHNAFGNGRRFCLGFVFAQMETTLFVSQMLYNHQIKVPNDFKPGMRSGIAIKPEVDLPITFERMN
jgi:cytochrome P450